MKTSICSTERIWRCLLLAMAMVSLLVTPDYAAQCPPNIFPGVNPASLTDPQAGLGNLYTFNNPILDSTKLQKYVTLVPNPLAPAFIYTPNGLQGGETLYTVSMREITQGLGLIYNNPLDAANNGCTAPPNTLWAYGDARDNGVTTAPTAPHSFPGPTFETTSNVPHRILFTNELPNASPLYHPANVDPTLDCGPKAPGCAPYNRVVPHVHGAHVADDSDGNPDQWYSPGFATVGHNWQPNTHIPGAVTGTYRFENTQEAGTIWYHDHAMGLTHLNVFAGLAGFHIIRDANETAMQAATPPALAKLPKYPFENMMAIQDRAFDTNGKLYSPDRPIQDMNATLTGVACDPLLPTTAVPPATVSPYACAPANLVNGIGSILLPTTPCDPAAPIAPVASPYACPVQYFTRNADYSLNVVPTGTTPPAGAFTAPSITAEYWGNVILVNGQAWPKQDVEKRVYRFRWLNGSDSRTYILRLVNNTTKLPIAGLDVWQIGTEQGFLNAPIKVMVNDPTAVAPPALPPFPQTNAIVIMPGERVDVLVDFTNVAAGTQVILQNLGPDAPYTGEYPPSVANAQTPTTIVPEIMLFNVVATFTAAIPNTMAPATITSLRAPLVALTPTPGTAVRTLYLAERVDKFGRLALTINGVDYMTAIDQFTRLNDVEEWDVVNLTPDGHPMHPHLVAFQLINRQDLIDPATALPFSPPAVLPLMGTPVTTQFNGVAPNPSLPTATGTLYPPDPNEVNSWKDTIFMPPGKVTRIKAKFDIPGLYVFHCHILSHEENDMMRSFAVTTPAASVTLTASATSQPSGAVAAPVTFTAAAKTGLLNHTDSNAYEYKFTVTPPAGVTVSQPDNMVYDPILSMGGVPSLFSAQGYSMVRTATWWPPNIPGTYVVTVTAKPMGAAAIPANLVTATLNYTVATASATAVTLAADPLKPSPQPVGAAITITATASGGTAPYQYEFWLSTPAGGWTLAQPFGALNTFNWNTTGAQGGDYRIAVHARGTGAPAGSYVEQLIGYRLTPGATTAVTLVPEVLKPSPQPVGTAVTFTATASGGTAPYEYAFWLSPPTGGWTLVQPFGGANTFNWNTAGSLAGTYRLAVHARSAGSSGTHVESMISYTIKPVAAAGLALAPSALTPSPQRVGTAITFTASANGGTAPYEYQFWLYGPTGVWTLVQPYGVANTFNWNTVGAQIGAYRIAVQARSAGSPGLPNGYDQERLVGFSLF